MPLDTSGGSFRRGRRRPSAKQKPGKDRTWTATEIRAATPFPKPEGAIAKAQEAQGGRLIGPLDSVERSMLRTIAETADLIDTGGNDRWESTRFWLLVPAPHDLIDFLSTFEDERGEDVGEDTDREPECDDEEDKEGDDNEDREPENEGGRSAGPVVTEERRARYRAARDAAADEQPFRLLPVYRAEGGKQ